MGVSIDEIGIVAVCFSADGKVLACGGTNNIVMAWDTQTWEVRVMKPVETAKTPR